jgi:hypothetical protein
MMTNNQFGKVAVGLRTAGYIDPAFFMAWTGLILSGLEDGDAILQPAVGRPHSLACNYIVAQFMGSDCDSLLFVDDDMVFNPRTLRDLRQTENVDICSALYVARRAPFAPVCLLYDKESDKFPCITTPKDIQDCDVVGLGFCLIKRHVIQAKLNIQKGDVFEWSNKHGEDGSFCLWAKEKGFRVAVNSGVRIGHRTTLTAKWNSEKSCPDLEYSSFGMLNQTVSANEIEHKERDKV